MNNVKRKFILLKGRVTVLLHKALEKFFDFLWFRLHLVNKHCRFGVFERTSPMEIHKVPDIKDSRFVFSVSYTQRVFDDFNELWYETKRGKRLYTISDYRVTFGKYDYRAELEAFYAHFSPKDKRWVYKRAPKVVLIEELPDGRITFDHKELDFSQCRFAFSYKVLEPTRKDFQEESYEALKQGLRDKVVEINEILTGAKYDGAILSPAGYPLADNLVCAECGCPVFCTSVPYAYKCINHGLVASYQLRVVSNEEFLERFEDWEHAIYEYSESPQDSNL